MKHWLENLCGKKVTGRYRRRQQDEVGKDLIEREKVGVNRSELLRSLQDLLTKVVSVSARRQDISWSDQ
jgi:hypothetical protein